MVTLTLTGVALLTIENIQALIFSFVRCSNQLESEAKQNIARFQRRLSTFEC